MTPDMETALEQAFTKVDDAFDSLDAGMKAVGRVFDEVAAEERKQ